MRKVAVFTGARAEYGLLQGLMKAIAKEPDLQLQVIASGAHFSPQYGETWREISADGFNIDASVEMLLASDSAQGAVKSMGVALIGFADALARLKPDILVVLGDRYETLAITQAAFMMKIPIAHLHGGEHTLGAYDDALRHAITKMASLHFVAAEAYRRRVIQLGEDPATVFNTGAIGIENILKCKSLSFEAFRSELGLPLQKPYCLVTLHSVTRAVESVDEVCEALFQIGKEHPELYWLFTYPNADNGAYGIVERLERYCQDSAGKAFIVKALGPKLYPSAIAYSEVVIGNSSSGIIEVPAFGIPSINIGMRQAGRLAADSVIHSKPNYTAIHEALTQALSDSFKKSCQNIENPYGKGHVIEPIINLLKEHKFTTVKPFCDWDIVYE